MIFDISMISTVLHSGKARSYNYY